MVQKNGLPENQDISLTHKNKGLVQKNGLIKHVQAT